MKKSVLAMLAILAVALIAGGVRFLMWQEVPATPTLHADGPFALANGHDRHITDVDFYGHATLVYFGYSRCPDICPTTMTTIAITLDRSRVGRPAKVAPLFITVDPERHAPTLKRDAASSPEMMGPISRRARMDAALARLMS